jgi:hypothetical protein
LRLPQKSRRSEAQIRLFWKRTADGGDMVLSMLVPAHLARAAPSNDGD